MLCYALLRNLNLCRRGVRAVLRSAAISRLSAQCCRFLSFATPRQAGPECLRHASTFLYGPQLDWESGNKIACTTCSTFTPPACSSHLAAYEPPGPSIPAWL